MGLEEPEDSCGWIYTWVVSNMGLETFRETQALEMDLEVTGI